jgi:hypothetical protein
VRSLPAAIVLFLPALSACTVTPKSTPKVGEEYEITKRYETAQQSNGTSSGSSRGQEMIVERVIGIREDGLEVEYDLPKEIKAEERTRNWQFPVRVFRPSSGPMQLLNGPELEARVDAWLKAAGWTRALCGRWIFTWNAFRIECDPQSVIKVLEALDLRYADLREGAFYRDAEARGSGTLARTATGPEGATFAVAMEIDPDAVRRARAESDVIVGEIVGKPVTLDAALSERSKESVSGTISITLVTDPGGNVQRRTKVTRVEIRGPDGRQESQTATEIVERALSGVSTTR